jgi:hypothetical protein
VSPASGPGQTGRGSTWARGALEPEEAWLAGAVALVTGAAVGGVALYLARTFLAREELPMRPRTEEEGSGG